MNGVKYRFDIQKQYWKLLIILVFGLTLIAWVLNTPPGLLGKADAIGYAVCHRIDLRSFHLGERQLPFCARCSGMYLGAMLGLGYQLIIGRRRTGIPTWKVILPISILALVFILDGVNSLVSLFPGSPILYQPNNSLRLLTGTGMGLAIAIMLYPAFNTSVWHRVDPRPSITGLGSFLLLLMLALGLDLLILTENPAILYLLSLVSAAGVLILLTMVYAMLLLMLFKAENRYNQLSQLIYALIGGFTVAMLQIGFFDLVRYFFTGTWEGFHL
jgi:uncharacterized membrane protein